MATTRQRVPNRGDQSRAGTHRSPGPRGADQQGSVVDKAHGVPRLIMRVGCGRRGWADRESDAAS